MGEGADRVTGGSPQQHVQRVSGEIEALRGELGALVGELDRRRQELFDVGLQVRRHPVAVAVAATAAALALGGLLALAVHRRRERRRPTVRARETRRALARIFDHPDRVGVKPGTAQTILAAAGAAAGTALAKRLVARYVAVPRAAPRRAPAEVGLRT